jgi:hypothetical protein
MIRKALAVGLLCAAGAAEASSIDIITLARWTDTELEAVSNGWTTAGLHSQGVEAVYNGSYWLKAAGRAEGHQIGVRVSSPAFPTGIPAGLSTTQHFLDSQVTFMTEASSESRVYVTDNLLIPGTPQSVFLVVNARVKGIVDDQSGLGLSYARYMLQTSLSDVSGTTGYVDWKSAPGYHHYDVQFNDLWLPAIIGSPFQLQLGLIGQSIPFERNGSSLYSSSVDFYGTAELEIVGVVDEVGQEVIGALAGLESGLGIDYVPEDNDPPAGEIPEPGPTMLVAAGLGLLALARAVRPS